MSMMGGSGGMHVSVDRSGVRPVARGPRGNATSPSSAAASLRAQRQRYQRTTRTAFKY